MWRILPPSRIFIEGFVRRNTSDRHTRAKAGYPLSTAVHENPTL